MGDTGCCNEYLHLDSPSPLLYYHRSARCPKNFELSTKSPPFSVKSFPFSRVYSGEVGAGCHVGAKSRLAAGENAAWKKLARRKKNSIFAQVCGACDIFSVSRRCSPRVAPSFSSRRHTAGDSAGTFARAARRSVDANLSSYFSSPTATVSC